VELAGGLGAALKMVVCSILAVELGSGRNTPLRDGDADCTDDEEEAGAELLRGVNADLTGEGVERAELTRVDETDSTTDVAVTDSLMVVERRRQPSYSVMSEAIE
jgi:hypothetical protein